MIPLQFIGIDSCHGANPIMNLLLQIIAGPREGGQHLLRPGSTFVIGRGRENDLSIPEDRFLSRRHLILTHQKNCWWVKDLGSSNGSSLDDQPLTRAVALDHGQFIQAGHTRIRVLLQTDADPEAPAPVQAAAPAAPAATEEPATVLRRSAATLGELAVSLFALVNLAQYPELTPLVETPGADCTALGREAGLEGLRLLSLSGRTDLLQLLTARQQETGGVVLFSSDAPLAELSRHLEGLLQVETDSGERLLFRYYSPAVLRIFLSQCPAALAERFFGPVSMFLLNAPDARTLTTFSRTDKGVTPRTVPVEKLCLS